MSSTSSVSDVKRTIREAIIKKRDSVPQPVRRIKDSALRERLSGLDGFKDARVILLYASFRSEPDTRQIIEEALVLKKKVTLPKVEGDRLAIYEIKSPADMTPGYMGIPEPVTSEACDIRDVEFILVPGAAFDERGYRAGYGKGYYDRLLGEVSKEKKPLCVSIAYEEQMVEEVPAEPHDVRVDIIITDRRVIACHE